MLDDGELALPKPLYLSRWPDVYRSNVARQRHQEEGPYPALPVTDLAFTELLVGITRDEMRFDARLSRVSLVNRFLNANAARNTQKLLTPDHYSLYLQTLETLIIRNGFLLGSELSLIKQYQNYNPRFNSLGMVTVHTINALKHDLCLLQPYRGSPGTDVLISQEELELAVFELLLPIIELPFYSADDFDSVAATTTEMSNRGLKIGYFTGKFMLHSFHTQLARWFWPYVDYLVIGIDSDTLITSRNQRIPEVTQQHRVDMWKAFPHIADKVVVRPSLTNKHSEVIKEYKALAVPGQLYVLLNVSDADYLARYHQIAESGANPLFFNGRFAQFETLYEGLHYSQIRRVMPDKDWRAYLNWLRHREENR